MLLNAELCVVLSRCERGSTVCSICLCLCVCTYFHGMLSFEENLVDIFISVFVCEHMRNTESVYMWLCASAELCHIVQPENKKKKHYKSGSTNSKGALRRQAIAVCLLPSGDIP